MIPVSPDFRFQDAWRKDDQDVFEGDETEPQPLFQDDYSRRPLWKTRTTTSPDIRPLLPLDQPCSDQSMTHVIANSREEMMKMIRDLPESSYELSLKDIVDLQSSQETKVEPSIEEEAVFFLNTNNPQLVKPNKKMTRSDSSMNKNAFLIKTLLFPSFSLSAKRKLVPPGNSSRIIPRSSKDKIHPRDKSVKEEAPRITNNKFRNEDDKHETTGCWPRKLKKWRCPPLRKVLLGMS
ncbi:hypothetical protein QQ045_019690 [Rhodiola kirilowii]